MFTVFAVVKVCTCIIIINYKQGLASLAPCYTHSKFSSIIHAYIFKRAGEQANKFLGQLIELAICSNMQDVINARAQWNVLEPI